jgi:hypothetical protein
MSSAETAAAKKTGLTPPPHLFAWGYEKVSFPSKNIRAADHYQSAAPGSCGVSRLRRQHDAHRRRALFLQRAREMQTPWHNV